MFKMFRGLGLLLPAPILEAAANAPFVPEYAFTGAFDFGALRPNAVEAPNNAALREDVDEAESWLANVEAREGCRGGAAMSAGGVFGWPRDHRQCEPRLIKQSPPRSFR